MDGEHEEARGLQFQPRPSLGCSERHVDEVSVNAQRPGEWNGVVAAAVARHDGSGTETSGVSVARGPDDDQRRAALVGGDVDDNLSVIEGQGVQARAHRRRSVVWGIAGTGDDRGGATGNLLPFDQGGELPREVTPVIVGACRDECHARRHGSRGR